MRHEPVVPSQLPTQAFTCCRTHIPNLAPPEALHLHVRAAIHGRKDLEKAAFPLCHTGKFRDLKQDNLVALSKSDLIALVRIIRFLAAGLLAAGLADVMI